MEFTVAEMNAFVSILVCVHGDIFISEVYIVGPECGDETEVRAFGIGKCFTGKVTVVGADKALGEVEIIQVVRAFVRGIIVPTQHLHIKVFLRGEVREGQEHSGVSGEGVHSVFHHVRALTLAIFDA